MAVPERCDVVLDPTLFADADPYPDLAPDPDSKRFSYEEIFFLLQIFTYLFQNLTKPVI